MAESTIETDLFSDTSGDGLPNPEDVVKKDAPTEVAVEIEDDTPEADRDVTRVADPDPEEDDLTGYDEKVQQRINKLRHGYHDERRAREAAERERQALVEYTQALQKKFDAVAKAGSSAEKSALEAALSQAKAKKDHAKAQLAKAGEQNLTWDVVADLQEQMADATFEIRDNERKIADLEKRALQTSEDGVQSGHRAEGQPSQRANGQQTVPEPDATTKSWMAKNSWFQSPDEPEMTALAYATHERLVRNGIDPAKQAERYWKSIDERMRKFFPDYNWPEKQAQSRQDTTTPRKFSQVSPGTRGTSPQKIKLTRSQAEIARRLGVPLEEYAKQLRALGE